MLINEFTSADAQLALLRLLMHSTWEAILQQQQYSKQASNAVRNRTINSRPKVGKSPKQSHKKSIMPNALPAFTPPPAKQAQIQAQALSPQTQHPVNPVQPI